MSNFANYLFVSKIHRIYLAWHFHLMEYCIVCSKTLLGLHPHCKKWIVLLIVPCDIEECGGSDKAHACVGTKETYHCVCQPYHQTTETDKCYCHGIVKLWFFCVLFGKHFDNENGSK